MNRFNDIADVILKTLDISILNMELEPSSPPNSIFTIHPKEFNMFKINKINEPENDLSITYKYNSDGYRSDDFDLKKDLYKKRIVFAGCSEGEGLGGNLELSWPKIVYDQIKDKEKADGFYNISFDNAGFQKILMNCMSYIKKYGNPDMLIIVFPDLPRIIEWNSKENKYSVEWYNLNETEKNINKSYFMNSIVNFISHMHMFESYCKTNEINLLWSIWSQLENEIFNELNVFNYFIPFNYFLLENNNELKTKQIKRDGHQGEYKHRLWATNILNHMDRL